MGISELGFEGWLGVANASRETVVGGRASVRAADTHTCERVVQGGPGRNSRSDSPGPALVPAHTFFL